MKATATHPSTGWPGQSWLNLATMMPGITMEINMTMEPTIRMGFLPTLSMMAMAGRVLMKKTTPVTPVAKRAVVPPVRPRLWKTLLA